MTDTTTRIFSNLTRIPQNEIHNVDILGGMTNVNYLIHLKNGKRYVLRIPGQASSDFVSRKHEFANNQRAHDLGVANEITAFDIEAGFKVTPYIKNAETLTPLSIAKYANTIAKKLSNLHNSKITFSNHFSVQTEYEKYRKIIKANNIDWAQDWDELDQMLPQLMGRLKRLGLVEAPCHNDPVPQNFIMSQVDEPQLFIIDWEYSGLNDPMWDVAAVMDKAGFDKVHEDRFINDYLALNPNLEKAVIKEKIIIFKILQCMLWYLWVLIKENKGDDFGGYHHKLHNAAFRFLNEYQSEYGRLS